MDEPAILTCALTGVLTDPRRVPVPVTPEEMAAEARRACDEGATVLHVHFRRQEPGQGHLPSWDPAVATEIVDAVRDACPEALLNCSTGVLGDDVSGPIACLERLRPEIAACNAGSLNYLKTRSDGRWAWPPMLFDNPVEKIEAMLRAMRAVGTRPEMECFDTGHLRSVGLLVDVGLLAPGPLVNFVMGVASGMPASVELLALLVDWRPMGSPWQVTAIGRAEVWPLQERAAELGGALRTGLEDTLYRPDGARARSNGELVAALAAAARRAGRRVATPDEARTALVRH
ncbi:MAG: 3-keto-5-aminohexanoate cleavage protein [Acidobacteriota bacterium]